MTKAREVRRSGKPANKTDSSRIGKAVALLSRNVVAASVLIGAIALSWRLVLLLVLPRPQPLIHDEFSYLLAADTFAQGRLTNPTHPMWIHFETFHELMHPTYASKYPPGMGLMLAFGQVVFHDPWAAVLIGMAVLCGLLTWALWAWLPSRWAIAGGLIAVLQLTGSYWTDSYWGGTLAAIGGALLLGALGRLMFRPAIAPSLAFALGLVILANTRPYEGLVLGAASTAFLLVRLRLLVQRGYQSYSRLARSVVLPMAFVLLPAFIWMGYYNYRVTGDPFLLPYQLYERQYAFWSPFLWSNHPRPVPKYNHEIFQIYYEDWDANENQIHRQHVLLVHLENLGLVLFFWSLPVLLCVLVGLRSLIRNRRLRIPLILLLLFYVGLAFEGSISMHYFAPATALMFLIGAAAVQGFLSWFTPGKARRWATLALICFMVAWEIFRITDMANPVDRNRRDFVLKREAVLKHLDNEPGQILVFVRYGFRHVVHYEWVYNAADIDGSRIVWAHSMPDGKDDELLRYYPNRRAFLFIDDGKATFGPMNDPAPKP